MEPFLSLPWRWSSRSQYPWQGTAAKNENNVNSLHALDCLAKICPPVPNVQFGKPKRKVRNILLFKAIQGPKCAKTRRNWQKRTWPYHFQYWGRSKVWPSLAFSGNDSKSLLDSRVAKFSLMRSTSRVMDLDLTTNLCASCFQPQLSANLASVFIASSWRDEERK